MGREGISLVEVLVALILLSVILSGLAMAGALAATDLRAGRAQLRVWAAAQEQMEQLTELGSSAVTSGSDTVQGYFMSWTVSGADPAKLALIVEWEGAFGDPTADTLVTYLARWRP